MAKDFRASQIQTTKIILSGGIGKSLGGAIYSGSDSTNLSGGIPNAMLSDVGSDVFLFVSGTKSNSDFSRTDVTLFGGDIVVSGTLYAERQVIEVDGQVDGDLIVTGNFYVEPDANSSESAAFRNAAGVNILTVNTTNKSVGIGEGTPAARLEVMADSTATTIAKLSQFAADGDAPDLVFYKARGTHASPSATVSGDFLGSMNFKGFNGSAEKTHAQIYGQSFGTISNSSNPGKIFFRTVPDGESALDTLMVLGGSQVLILSGGSPSSPDQSLGNDVAFFVSGSRHSRTDHDTVVRADRSISLFGGDIISSGAIETHAGELFVLDSVGAGSVNGVKIAKSNDGNEVYKIVNARTDTNGIVVSSGGASTEILTIELDHLPLFTLSGSTSTNRHKVHVNEGKHDTDFVVTSQGKDFALAVDGGLNQVLIHSGGSPSSFDESSPPDVSFYVSGTRGSHGSGVRGTSVFGGDTYTSGSAYINTLFVENEDPTIVFREPAGSDKATIGVNNSDNIQIENKSINKHIVLKVNDGGVVREGFRVDGAVAEVVVNQGSDALVDFRVESDNKTHAIFVDGATDKVMILSGGIGPHSETLFTDVNFFVSGTVGSRGTAVSGTSLFGGDVVTSGSHNVLKGAKVESGATFNDSQASADFRVASTNNANMLVVKGSTDRVGIGTVASPQATLHLKESAPTFRIQRSNNSNNSTVEFVGQAGATATMVHLATSNDLVFSTHDGVDQEEILRLGGHQISDVRQVILLSGSAVAASAMQPQEISDINFFVSGAIGSAGSALRGTSVFGGDLVVSGAVRTEQAVFRNIGTVKTSNFNVSKSDHFIRISPTTTHITASLESAAAAGTGREIIFKDIRGVTSNSLIVIKPNGSDKIEGVNDDIKIEVASGSISLISDGVSDYYVFAERD